MNNRKEKLYLKSKERPFKITKKTKIKRKPRTILNFRMNSTQSILIDLPSLRNGKKNKKP